MQASKFPTRKLVIATKNQGKRKELQELLGELGFEVEDLSSYPELPEIIEDGETFEANALKKAQETYQHVRQWVLADDSGLSVDALNGAPGVYSARYAGEPSDDARNNDKLLNELQGVPLEKRGAQFVCVLALVTGDQEPVIVRGELQGRIASAPRGEHGFGYDPLFELPGKGMVMAELTREEKNLISHRALALQKLVVILSP
jgi:XTP/dITP diphosphohydrolase